MVEPPLEVFAGLKLPQDELPQATDQLTPALAVSLLTEAARLAVPPRGIEGGAGVVSTTEIAGADVIAMVTATDLVESLTDVAVKVTVFPEGTDEGAV
jgi:hypothetical protein